MFAKVLIANRGEIACRVARTARRLGVRTVAVYSDADVNALHVEVCDEAYRLGPPAPRESYLDAAAIIRVAKRCGADAIHPGYGFLSENADFAAACTTSDVVFIGPPPSAIAAMGSKSAAKRIMVKAGVPVVPGYHGDDQNPDLLAREAEKIGYPVLIKASAGGGGKGMKIVKAAGEFSAALASARREAESSFDDDRVLLEKYLESPRHIEIQLFADQQGNAVYLFERDCSVQRRHQKVLEEAPAPHMHARQRRAMGEAAVAAAKAIGYVGAGTVEFIASSKFAEDGAFYFMEMNTRLQVEHPVTEMITGLDLVEWQLRVAAGEPLPKRQDELTIDGHAIEARIYAEDPARGFLPSIGRIAHWRMPTENRRVRVDTGFRAGDEVTPFYDPMLAKLIVWAEDRDRACAEMLASLRQCEVAGVITNIELLERIVAHPAFASGNVDTGLIDRHRDAFLDHMAPAPDRAWIAAALADYARLVERSRREALASSDPHSPWHCRDAWGNGATPQGVAFGYRERETNTTVMLYPRPDGRLEIRYGAATLVVSMRGDTGRFVVDDGAQSFTATVIAIDESRDIFLSEGHSRIRLLDPLAHAGEVEEHAGHLMAPMSGTVVAVMVKPGDQVDKGAPLVLLEAMKMEHTIAAPAAGIVASVNCAVGERVNEGTDLVDLADVA